MYCCQVKYTVSDNYVLPDIVSHILTGSNSQSVTVGNHMLLSDVVLTCTEPYTKGICTVRQVSYGLLQSVVRTPVSSDSAFSCITGLVNITATVNAVDTKCCMYAT